MSADGNPVEMTDQHADIRIYDSAKNGVFLMFELSPLIVDDILYVATSNGVGWSQ